MLGQTFEKIIDALRAANEQRLSEADLSALRMELRQWSDELATYRTWLQPGSSNPHFKELSVEGKFQLGYTTGANVYWDPGAGALYFRNGTTIFNKMSGGSLQTYGIKLSRTSDQVISNNNDTPIQFTVEDYDDTGFANLGTDNTKITIPAGYGGRYMLGFIIPWASAANGYRFPSIEKNASSTTIVGVSNLGDHSVQTASGEAVLADGDYIRLMAYQTSGGNLTVPASAAPCAMWAYKIR
jgi:hypothetical protein